MNIFMILTLVAGLVFVIGVRTYLRALVWQSTRDGRLPLVWIRASVILFAALTLLRLALSEWSLAGP
jgi:hypothetical protein